MLENIKIFLMVMVLNKNFVNYFGGNIRLEVYIFILKEFC